MSKSSLLVDVTGYKNNISMKGAFIMSLIDTIISKALEFEGVSESPPGSNMLFLIQIIMERKLKERHIPGALLFVGCLPDV